MTLNELIQLTKRRLTAIPDGAVWADREIEIAAAIPAALHDLGIQVMRDNHRRNLLQQSYSVTLDAAGVGNLLTPVGSITATTGEILMEGVSFGVVRDAESNLLRWIPHYSDFLRPALTAYAYYCLVASRIHTRAIAVPVTTPQDIATAPGPLTVHASYAPAAVASVPEELESETVDILTEIVMRQVSEKDNGRRD